MRLSHLALTFGAAMVDALVARDTGCKVHLSADGDIKGTVGDISSGQVRAGNIDSSTFVTHGDTVYNSKGHGCWWTPPEHVLQCDVNQTPDNGFDFGCDGSVSYKGQKTFYECKTDEDGQYNIYLEPNGEKCGKITLKADGCHKDCKPAPSQHPPPPQQSPQQPSPPHTSEKHQPTEGCSGYPVESPKPVESHQPASWESPKKLGGNYEYPHLIVPVDKNNPYKAGGTSYFGEVSSSVSTIFNFDVPAEDKDKKCSLVFLFPKKEDLETSSYSLSGSGELDFCSLKSTASEKTSHDNEPAQDKDFGKVTIAPGNAYKIATFDCPAGKTVSYEIKAVGDTKIKYFQDYNPSPIGLYITKE